MNSAVCYNAAILAFTNLRGGGVALRLDGGSFVLAANGVRGWPEGRAEECPLLFCCPRPGHHEAAATRASRATYRGHQFPSDHLAPAESGCLTGLKPRASRRIARQDTGWRAGEWDWEVEDRAWLS